MNNVALFSHIPTMSDSALGKIYEFESIALKQPQIDIHTSHIIHAGMYARTIKIPAGNVITGALIKIATLLIVQGDVIAHIGEESIEFSGYNVLPANAHRKQVFFAKSDTYLTMIFSSDAKTIKEAEEEFTDEAHLLLSRKNTLTDKIIMTED